MSEGRSYRGRTASERVAARRRALLDAALDLLSDPGSGATMTAICERARLTERYFYESFRNRDELLLTLLDEIAAEVRAAVEHATAAPVGEGGDPDRDPDRDPDLLGRSGLEALLAVLGDDPRKGRFALVTSAQLPVLRERRRALLDGFAALLTDRTRQLYGTRAWDAPDDRIEAFLFVGGLAELLAAWLVGDLEATREQVVDAATRHFAATAHR